MSALSMLSASAQSTANSTQALNLDTKALQRFSQGINIGKIAVDSTAITADSVKIFLNSALQNVPMRPDNVTDITKTIADGLPSEFKGRKLDVFVNGCRLERLIPECYRPKHGDVVRFSAFRNLPAEGLGKSRTALERRHTAL